MAEVCSGASPCTEHPHKSTIKSSFPLTSSSRCTQCNALQRDDTRNLVVCIDSTSNQKQVNHIDTNVKELYNNIDLTTCHPKPKQLRYPFNGADKSPKRLHIFERMERAVSDTLDMAIAWNMEDNVKRAYRWLAETYQEGDQIYLFGFSEGAYQVRVLARMIHEVGLIETPTEELIKAAYGDYIALRSGKLEARRVAREFKNTFARKNLGVHFIGVWDTVSSMGLMRDRFLSTSSSVVHACYFRHALALDELRVNFIPEYFHEMNSHIGSEGSKYTSPLIPEHATAQANEQRESLVRDNDIRWSTREENNRLTDIKEVWFAGSHSDVGGVYGHRKPRQAGRVSLLWMRREAVACGLVLKPTDMVWVPGDLDLGVSDPMTPVWQAIEYMPIKHQISFSGSGEDVRRLHRLQPRRIIPGQKVHASVLYAYAYNPQATLGEGFDIPTIHTDFEDSELHRPIWEKGMFDDTAAQELAEYLGSHQGGSGIFLDQLLFMLRFDEGKECVKHIPGLRDKLKRLIHNSDENELDRLVAIIAYYEASYDPNELLPAVFDYANKCLRNILAGGRFRDGPKVVALLRLIVKHPTLRWHILDKEVLNILMGLLDKLVGQPEKGKPGKNFGHAMEGLNCLLGYADTQQTIIEKLSANSTDSKVSRLSRILEVKDLYLLTAALRMVLTLARIGEAARSACLVVKPRLRKLARKHERLVGLLAVEILFAQYDRSFDPKQLTNRNPRFIANLASALVRLNIDKRDSTDEADIGDRELHRVFGLGVMTLEESHKELLGELRKAARGGNTPVRTAATMTLLKLCETVAIRNYLNEINLLGVLVNQLRYKESALLAAYALVICLQYDDMKVPMEASEHLPKNIVNMLRLDYFDDAIGQVEGFQIFGNLMRNGILRRKTRSYDITGVLETKLGKGKAREIRTSLICLSIFRTFEPGGPWTKELVDKSLKYLRSPVWKDQKAGVAILSALARTAHGEAAIIRETGKIIEMLHPSDYLHVQRTEPITTSVNLTSSSEAQQLAATTAGFSNSKSPSWMLGPACALRVLAQNEALRHQMRQATQYVGLRHLYLSGTLVEEGDTSAWRVRTPNRVDVLDMLNKMIKAIDGELLEGPMSIEDTALPHIQHWSRLMALVRDRTVGAAAILSGVLGVSTLAILSAAVATPIILSVQLYTFLRRSLLTQRDVEDLRGGLSPADIVDEAQTEPPNQHGQGEGALNHGASTSVEDSDESSHGIDTIHSRGRGIREEQLPQ